MTDAPGGFWLARGPCGTCGRPAAKRVAGPGTHEVYCNVCRTATRHPAEYRAPAGTPPAPILGPAAPAAPPEPSPSPASASSRGALPVLKWAVPLVLVVALGAAGAYWAISREGAEEPIAWSRLEQAAVPEFGPDGVTVRIETRAFDARNEPIPIERVAAVPAWYFANATTRAADAESIAGWTPCDPLTCAYSVPLGQVVYFNSFGPEGRGAYALDTATRNLSRFAFDEWRPEAWDGRIVGFATARTVGTTPGEDGEWRVMVFSNASNADERTLNVSFVQAGEVVDGRAIDVRSPFGDAWKMPEFSARVKEGPVEVRVTDEAGTLLASKTITPSDCDKLETQVYVALLPDGRVSLDEVLCI